MENRVNGVAETLKPEWKPLRKIEYVSTVCPICKSGRFRLKYSKKIRDIHMCYYVCLECKVLYANPRAAVESLRQIYASSDFFSGGSPGGDHLNYHDFIGGEKYLRMTARDRLMRIKKYCSRGKMLEVASAAGFFLAEAKAAGYEVSGVEFSEPLASFASKKWNVSVIPESIERIDFPEGVYDVIASWGVMTIIQDPLAIIRKFYRALKPGGVWAFNTYYYEGLWPRIVGSRWDILTVNFSQLYTKQLLIDLISKNGFKLLSRRRERPYTDLMKIADKLVQTLKMSWLPSFLRRCGMGELIVKIPLPDVMEYIWEKQN